MTYQGNGLFNVGWDQLASRQRNFCASENSQVRSTTIPCGNLDVQEDGPETNRKTNTSTNFALSIPFCRPAPSSLSRWKQASALRRLPNQTRSAIARFHRGELGREDIILGIDRKMN